MADPPPTLLYDVTYGQPLNNLNLSRNTGPTVPAFLKPRSQTVPVIGVHQENFSFLQYLAKPEDHLYIYIQNIKHNESKHNILSD